MDRLSILIGLNGSQHSQFAAELSWDLAKRSGGRVTAQHVVDTHAAWSMLRFEQPGFIGSGPYVDAYSNLEKSLESIAEKLGAKYQAVAEGNGVESDVVIDSGDPVTEICKRAAEHQIVVVGHNRAAAVSDPEQRRLIKYEIAESLAHSCQTPLIVCQERHTSFKTMKILIGMDHFNMNYLESCINLATLIGVEPKILCIGTDSHEERAKDLKRDIRAARIDLQNVSIDVQLIKGTFVEERQDLWRSPPLAIDLDHCLDQLTVVPTRATGNERITLLGSLSSDFVHSLQIPNVMLCPEEHVFPILANPAQLAVKDSRRIP